MFWKEAGVFPERYLLVVLVEAVRGRFCRWFWKVSGNPRIDNGCSKQNPSDERLQARTREKAIGTMGLNIKTALAISCIVTAVCLPKRAPVFDHSPSKRIKTLLHTSRNSNDSKPQPSITALLMLVQHLHNGAAAFLVAAADVAAAATLGLGGLLSRLGDGVDDSSGEDLVDEDDWGLGGHFACGVGCLVDGGRGLVGSCLFTIARESQSQCLGPEVI